MARILIIDDEPMVRQQLADGLQAAGHEILTAVDGLDALNEVHQAAPDLIISDILMPNADGIELLMSLRQEKCQIPVIAISGGGRYGDTAFLGTARVLGAARTMIKPFRIEDLLAAIDELLAA